MSFPENAAGRVLMVGVSGSRPEPETGEILREIGPGGLILFRRNLHTPESLADLIRWAADRMAGPPLLALDQEGGRVSRLNGWVGPTPAASRLASRGSGAVRRFAAATAEALRVLGLNVDFAPVVDLSEPGAPNGIGDRSFGTDPSRVTELARAFLEGLEGAGVAGCLKHFPGLGGTSVDSHQALPLCLRSRAALEAGDLVPFRELAPVTPMVMVGHGTYPALDGTEGLPASLSREVITGWLRRRLRFEGLIVSDDMEMGALAGHRGEGEEAVEAVASGCDMVLYCGDPGRALHARDRLARRAAREAEFAARLHEAARRVRSVAERYPAPAPRPAAWGRAAADLHAAARPA